MDNPFFFFIVLILIPLVTIPACFLATLLLFGYQNLSSMLKKHYVDKVDHYFKADSEAYTLLIQNRRKRIKLLDEEIRVKEVSLKRLKGFISRKIKSNRCGVL